MAVDIQNIPPNSIRIKDNKYAITTEVVVAPKTDGSTLPPIKLPAKIHIDPKIQNPIVLASTMI